MSGSVLLCYTSDCTYQNELVTAAHIRIHAQTFQIAEKEILVHLQAHSTKQVLITNLNSIKDILKDSRSKLHRKWLHTHWQTFCLLHQRRRKKTIYQENSSHLQSRCFHLDSESATEKDNHKFLWSICHPANKKAPHNRLLQNEYQKTHRKNDQDSHNSTLCVRRTGSLTVNPAVSSYTVPKPENNVQGYVHSERILSSLSAFWICCISNKITVQNTFLSITSVDGC